MHTKFKLFLGVAAFFLMGLQTASAQIFQSKQDIIKEYGNNYTVGTSKDNTKYFLYEMEDETKASGKFTKTKAIYFVELEDKTEVCYMWKLFYPSSETNSIVNEIKDGLVQTDYMEWKDYETSILYKVTVNSGICVITALYDNEK